MAILTIWADKKVEGSEQDFLKRFCIHLGFTESDLENSMMALEGFVLEHWGKLDYLQNKQDYNEVSDRFIKRMSQVAGSNENKLLKEVQESSELMDLLKKAKANELTEQEKNRMQGLLIQVMKTIPTFAIISLPQRFLTLPILLKILPGNFFSKVA